MKLNCGHAYHEKCIYDAVKHPPTTLNNFRCPQCRELTYVHRDVHDCNELKGNIDNRHVNDILLAAAEIGLKELVTSSLAKKADLSCTDDRGSTPLHLAAHNGHTDIFRLLLDHGAEVNEINYYGETPLHQAATMRHPDIVSLIMERGVGVNVDALNSQGQTPLLQALAYQLESSGSSLLPAVVSKLAGFGADINRRYSFGPQDSGWRNSTPLYSASGSGHTTAVEMLISLGADASLLNNNKYSPLHAAAEKGHVEICKMLLSHTSPAYVNLRGRDGQTALSLAAKYNKMDVLRLLLAAGAGWDRSMLYFYTMSATRVIGATHKFDGPCRWNVHRLTNKTMDTFCKHCQNVVVLLLLAGADPNTDCDCDGDCYCSRSPGPAAKTPLSCLLFCTSESGNTELVQQLLLAGASTGRGDVLVAKQNGHAKVVEILEIAAVSRQQASSGAAHFRPLLEPSPVRIDYTHFPFPSTTKYYYYYDTRL